MPHQEIKKCISILEKFLESMNLSMTSYKLYTILHICTSQLLTFTKTQSSNYCIISSIQLFLSDCILFGWTRHCLLTTPLHNSSILKPSGVNRNWCLLLLYTHVQNTIQYTGMSMNTYVISPPFKKEYLTVYKYKSKQNNYLHW